MSMRTTQPRIALAKTRWAVRALLLAILFSLAGSPCVSAAQNPETDAEIARSERIMAAVVFHIVKFVSWPDDAKHAKKTIRICTLGQDDLLNYVKEAITGKSIKGIPLEILELAHPDQLLTGKTECAAIFLAKGAASHLTAVSNYARANSILSICHIDVLHWSNCMMYVFKENNKARVAIDREMAENARLQISSELLELAVLREPSRRSSTER